MTRSRAARASVLVLAAALLTGCSTHPGAAAVVGDESISSGQVDDLALALCAAQTAGGQPGQDVAARAARQGALQVLVSSALSREYGRANGVRADAAQVSAAVAANQATLDQLPASRREVFRDTLRTFAEGQLVLVAAGRRQLAERGNRKPTDDQALAAGTSLRDAWAAKNIEVGVDPRFGRFTSGALQPRSGSLSVPVSSGAAAGAKQQPAADWVGALPASQKCR